MTTRVDPKQQFSKKLARWTAVFWFIYMGWLGVVLYLAPGSGMYAVYMSIVSSVVMIINIFQYTSNSKFEKALLTMLDRTALEIKIGNGTIKANVKDEPDESEEATHQEGDDG